MSHRSVFTEQCIYQENMVIGLKFPFLADLYGMTPRPGPLSLIPNPLRHTLEARPPRRRHSRQPRFLDIGAIDVRITSVIGVDGAKDARVRADRHGLPPAPVRVLAHGDALLAALFEDRRH